MCAKILRAPSCWRNKTKSHRMTKKRLAAMKRGSAFHKAVEHFVKEGKKMNGVHAKMYQGLADHMAKEGFRVMDAEVHLKSRHRQGTVDVVFGKKVQGKRVMKMVELKTGFRRLFRKSTKKSVLLEKNQTRKEHLYQVACYMSMWKGQGSICVGGCIYYADLRRPLDVGHDVAAAMLKKDMKCLQNKK